MSFNFIILFLFVMTILYNKKFFLENFCSLTQVLFLDKNIMIADKNQLSKIFYANNITGGKMKKYHQWFWNEEEESYQLLCDQKPQAQIFLLLVDDHKIVVEKNGKEFHELNKFCPYCGTLLPEIPKISKKITLQLFAVDDP